MTLNELKDGQKAIIVNLNAHKELKNRLLSFGFIKNKNLKKIHSSLKNAVGGKIKCRKRKIKCRIFATNYLSFNLKLKL